ncbi:MAG: NAD-glutamate dehydrogenase [Planctomycetota bacterium]|jgi:glutamate dehydrogenase|nr:NAD-glutamate dehydrogenase [Planctomycetota bacterium]
MSQVIDEAVIATLADGYRSGLLETATWLNGHMADYYFRVTSEHERLRHLEVIHGLRQLADARLTVVDDREAQKLVVVGRPNPDALSQALLLIGEHEFHRIAIHTADDRSLAIFSFVYGDTPPPADFDWVAHRRDILEGCCSSTDCVPRHVVERYLDAVDEGYLARSYPERIARHVRAWTAVDDPEHVFVQVDRYNDENGKGTRFQIALAMDRRPYIDRLARLLRRHGLFLDRGYMDHVPSLDGKDRLLISSIYVTDAAGKPLGKRQSKIVATELLGIRRSFVEVLGRIYADSDYAQHHFEVLVAGVDIAAQILTAEHSFLDVREVGREVIATRVPLCRRIAELVDHRFGPKMKSPRAWKGLVEGIRDDIRQVEDAGAAAVLEAMLEFICAIQATNLYCEQRLGQAFRIDPAILPKEQFAMQPYGVFYFHGAEGMGFQVRFRASARGGLRLLLPRTAEQLSRVRNKLLREVYDLAWAQQLKNKDIPEGGSKCIALVRPGGDADRMVRQLGDSLLDLALPPERMPNVRGPHGKARSGELIFLGPDENMNPERIMWIADRARFRGLPYHLTLMSSKPGSGINHKEYGVTSEGVYTWIPQVLQTIGVGAKETWTLKMTGGPDGDVGGNLIKILHREQAKRCRIVAIGDGSGCAYDPDGLDWRELLRLVRGSKPIVAFKASKLKGKGGHVTPATDRAGEEMRNNLHNMVVADLFVPCGGRPYTINDRNWPLFCDSAGKPSARAMVEGANIFITPKARRELQRAGLVVIKDSSANKGGVITSSYEILAGLVTSEAEFAEIKDVYVQQVITKLRRFVEWEAAAVMEAWRRRRKKALLSDLQQEFSEEINRLYDLFAPSIDKLADAPHYEHIWLREYLAHAPKVLADTYADRLVTQVPRAHRIAVMTKRLASSLLYREGLTWCRNYVTAESSHEVLLAYLDAWERVHGVFEELRATSLAGKDDLAKVMELGSRRELIRHHLGTTS